MDTLFPSTDPLDRGAMCALILPLAYQGLASWGDLLTQEAGFAALWPIIGRPWSVVREVAVYVWWHRDDAHVVAWERLTWKGVTS